ncbi:MAG: cbb3-type cytochrome c oxidase subunit I [Candidatus Firestonebacteria bacterium]
MENNELTFETKWTIRYVLAALGFLFLTIIEGMMMRISHIKPDCLSTEHFYSVMTVHPILGIYGYAYMAIMGAFYFLMPYLLKTQVYNKKLIPLNFWMQSIGVIIVWCSGFFTKFNALYTLYWPLPVWFSRISNLGAVIFCLGAAITLVNILLFTYNIFATMIKRKPVNGAEKSKLYSFGDYLKSAFGLDRIFKKKKEIQEENKLYDTLPVFVVAVARGSIDTVVNAFVILTCGILILIFAIPSLLGFGTLNPHIIDALIYKNWFWWGLDMIADGNVLMYAAGTWYLLIPMLVNRKLFGEGVVRTVILADLLISLGVWSHHLLADQPQPLAMHLISGQFITSGEIVTVGLTIFASLMTIYLARPVKFTPALKFILVSMFGFMLGAVAGITQANYGLNVVLHNTQWVIGIHGHTMLLLGLSPLLFAIVYALIPLLLNREMKSHMLVNLHLIFWVAGVLIMVIAMGSAGLNGMLRRTIYHGIEFKTEMNIAMIGGISIVIGFLCLLINLIRTLTLKTIINIVFPLRRTMN